MAHQWTSYQVLVKKETLYNIPYQVVIRDKGLLANHKMKLEDNTCQKPTAAYMIHSHYPPHLDSISSSISGYSKLW